LWIRDADYWTIRNLNFDATGVNSCVFGAVHIHAVTRNAIGNQILNNTFRGWGFLSTDVASYPAAVVLNGGALGPTQGFWPTGTLIKGNTFDGNRLSAISLLHTQDTIIEENEIRNQQCGRDSDTAVNTLGVKATYHNKGLLVRANNIHDFQPSAGQSGGCALPNQAWPTIAGFWCDVGGTNTTIEGNQIWNLNQNKTDQSNPNGNNIASMGIFVEAECQSHMVRKNVIYNIGNFGIRNDYHSFNSAQLPNRYYNNTIYDAHRSAVLITNGVVDFRNNIIRARSLYNFINIDPSNVKLTADFNLYHATSQVIFANRGPTTYSSLSAWRTACACDANSNNADPLFVNESGLDFYLQAASPAVGAGEGGADIGAYPYLGSQLAPPNPPGNVMVVPN
jgi:hypothetical protein